MLYFQRYIYDLRFLLSTPYSLALPLHHENCKMQSTAIQFFKKIVRGSIPPEPPTSLYLPYSHATHPSPIPPPPPPPPPHTHTHIKNSFFTRTCFVAVCWCISENCVHLDFCCNPDYNEGLFLFLVTSLYRHFVYNEPR